MSEEHGRSSRAIPTRFAVPPPRAMSSLLRAAHGLWTLPTNVFGHLAGLVLTARRPRRVGGPAARAWLYTIPNRSPFARIGGVALGHAILLSEAFLAGERGRLILAHELAHTRQHDVFGPAYLPLHLCAQMASALRYLVAPRPESDPVHAYNPLEQTWISLGHDAIRRAREEGWDVEPMLRAFGV